VQSLRLLRHGPHSGRRLPGRWGRRGVKCSGDIRYARAVALPASGTDTSRVAGPLGALQSKENVHAKHSCVEIECEWCVRYAKIRRTDSGSVCDVTATRVPPSHFCVCGWDTGVSSIQWPVLGGVTILACADVTAGIGVAVLLQALWCALLTTTYERRYGSLYS
jgi:hypothetical protein